MQTKVVQGEIVPDAFGWRTSWISVKDTRTELMLPELRLVSVRSCDWNEGIQESGKGGIFVSPPVGSWILIVGITLPDASSEDCLPLIVRLSEICECAQYFGNHRVPDYYAWAKAEYGRLKRAYAFLGEKGTTLWDRGPLTEEEKELDLIFDAGPARNSRAHPTESDVFALARKWSVDPTQIEEYDVSSSPGLLGFVKKPAEPAF